jgi:hypothetical protein
MNGQDIDDISIVAALRPAPPADAEQIRQRARRRLEVALAGAGPYRLGRLRRNRHRLALGLAATAAVVGAVIAVPAVLPGSAGSIVTKAWAVTRSPDGTITVTIKQTLSDQAALQRALRAEGVPAYVRSMNGCRYWEPAGGLQEIRANDVKAVLFPPAPGNTGKTLSEIIIHPGALRKGWALFIGGSPARSGWTIQMYIMTNDHPPVCVPARAGSRSAQGNG